MKTAAALIAIFLTCAGVQADEQHISSREPVTVQVPEGWKLEKLEVRTAAFPFETYRAAAPDTQNAACLLSVLDKNRPGFTNSVLLQKIVKGDSRPYVSPPVDLATLEPKELKINGGLGFYANFTDPDLKDKPVEKGNYKTATPVILSLGTNYLVKATVMCDEIDGTEYKAAIRMVESIRIKKE